MAATILDFWIANSAALRAPRALGLSSISVVK